MQPTDDIARAIARLRDQIRDQQETNQPPERLTVSEFNDETITVAETTTASAQSGNNRYLTYDDGDSYDFAEYE